MILVWLILIPIVGGLLAWLLGRWSAGSARWIALLALAADAALIGAIVCRTTFKVVLPVEFDHPWIPTLGIRFQLAADGLSLLLVSLTVFLGIVAVAASWREITRRVGFFHFNLLWVLSGLLGVFLAVDMFLFFFFWEMMLIPMYFLIVVWGHENRRYAATKFFLFTQLGGLLMLLSILGVYFIQAKHTGNYSFDYREWSPIGGAGPTTMLLMLGFFAAFAVKLPMFPVHTWLPDAHTEAPTAGSVILAGLMLKTGAYGLIRFAVPLFPEAAAAFAPVAMILAIAGILYGGTLAFAQTDLKRMVAYTSVSHMGFVLLGVFAGNALALQGAILQIVCHGLSTGALFVLVGALQERIHTRDVRQMGGLWAAAPRMGAVALFFAMASLGLPGLGNFVAEFLVLLGTYQVSPALAAVASLGLIAAMIYSLWFVQAAFHGPRSSRQQVPDLGLREMAVMTAMMAALVWLGLYPQPVLNAYPGNPEKPRPVVAVAEQSAKDPQIETSTSRRLTAAERLANHPSAAVSRRLVCCVTQMGHYRVPLLRRSSAVFARGSTASVKQWHTEFASCPKYGHSILTHCIRYYEQSEAKSTHFHLRVHWSRLSITL